MRQELLGKGMCVLLREGVGHVASATIIPFVGTIVVAFNPVAPGALHFNHFCCAPAIFF
jgi:hypothetical protein